jgi:glycosyltransferase involved in cell wall biosynthesis
MSIDSPPEVDLSVLNAVVATPDARGGAIRSGLQYGAHLGEVISVDTVKMRGTYDEELLENLTGVNEFDQIPAQTGLRDVCRQFNPSNTNYCNTLIWTDLEPPSPLESYDLVHIHNAVPLAGMLSVGLRSRQAGIPYAVTTHGISKIPKLPGSEEMSTGMNFVFDHGFLKAYRWVLGNATLLFALSRSDKETLRAWFPGQSVRVLPNGVHPNQPTPTGIRRANERFDIEESELVVLFVGKLIASKGIQDLLEAYKRVDVPATLYVVGPAERRDYIDEINVMDDVEYPGYLDQPGLDGLYQRADLFAFPTRSDVFPLVNLEAMAAATPVITTDVGGIPEQITDASGMIVSPESPREVATAMEELLTADERRQAMSEDAFDHATETFTWDQIAHRAVRAYSDELPAGVATCRSGE